MRGDRDELLARAVKREDLRGGAELLGLPLETHIGNVIESMRDPAVPREKLWRRKAVRRG